MILQQRYFSLCWNLSIIIFKVCMFRCLSPNQNRPNGFGLYKHTGVLSKKKNSNDMGRRSHGPKLVPNNLMLVSDF